MQCLEEGSFDAVVNESDKEGTHLMRLVRQNLMRKSIVFNGLKLIGPSTEVVNRVSNNATVHAPRSSDAVKVLGVLLVNTNDNSLCTTPAELRHSYNTPPKTRKAVEVAMDILTTDKPRSELRGVEDANTDFGEANSSIVTFLERVIESESSEIGERSAFIGRDMFKRFLDMYGDMIFTKEDVLFSNTGEKENEDIIYSGSDGEDNVDGRNRIPYAVKIKAVKLADLHPKWSLATLQKRSTSKTQLSKWGAQIEQDGTRNDKRFTEARNQRASLVTTRILQQWAMAAAF
ncbi:hypothetical protein FQA39_LY08330 [Lamprigera yunnana]|nr:hypothetical protein FQA39_LY08330 [Lamprigera yunnana]